MAFVIETEPTTSIPMAMGKDGVIYVERTRVPLDTVVWAFQSGATPEEIHYQYPSLSLEAIYAVIGYYLGHRTEVDGYLAARQKHATVVRRQNEARFPPDGIRTRLLARRHAQSE